jgi:dihydroorotate dehydrogenase
VKKSLEEKINSNILQLFFSKKKDDKQQITIVVKTVNKFFNFSFYFFLNFYFVNFSSNFSSNLTRVNNWKNKIRKSGKVKSEIY